MLSESQAKWLAEDVLPHEADVRRWLSRYSGIEADDVIQEAWVILATIDRTTVRFPRRLFFVIARNIVLQHYRRARIVSFSSLADITEDCAADDGPDPEQRVSARKELEFLNRVISELPPRCRTIFTLHRIHGYSHKECAEQLDLSENVVAKQMGRALRLIGDAYGRQESRHEIGDRSFFPVKSHKRRT